jgi:hypothetical protein
MWSGVSTLPPDFNILVMWSLFLINALCGLYIWFTNRNNSNDQASKTVEESAQSSTKDSLETPTDSAANDFPQMSKRKMRNIEAMAIV